jgi:ribosomal protein S18 acetylase RimI-like enzyme
MFVRKASDNEMDRCDEIATSLIEWFDEDALVEISKDIRTFETYICEDNGKIIGFMCIKDKFNSALEIKWMGVDASHQNTGAGTKLIEYIETELACNKFIIVKTLDSSNDYSPYIATRAFYEKNGFVKIDIIFPYPGWSDDCPCAIYVKA